MAWRRKPYVDEVHEGDEAVVLLADRAIKIGGLGPYLLDLIGDRACELDDLCRRLEESLGVPESGSASELVLHALTQLANEQLIESTESDDSPNRGEAR